MADDRLTWLLELQAKLDGVARFSKETEHTERALREADATTQKLERSIGGLSGVAGAAAGKLGQAGAAAGGFLSRAGSSLLGNLGANAIGAVVGGVANFASGVFHAADETERLTHSFDLLVGQDQRKIEFEWLERLGREIPGTADDLMVLERRLLSLGVPLAAMDEALVGASDLAVRTGMPIDAIVDQFGEVIRGGQITTRMLKSLGLSEAQALGPLAAALKMSTDGVKQMMDAGKIGGLDALRSILHGLAENQGGALGEPSKRAGATLLESMKDMENAWGDLWKKGVIAVGPSLSRAIRTITDKLTEEGGLGDKLGKGIERVADWVAKVDWERGVGKFLAVLEKSLGVAGKIADMLGLTDAPSLGERIGDWAFNLGSGPATLGKIGGGTPQEKLAAAATRNPAVNIGGLPEWLPKGEAAGAQFGKSLIDGARRATDTHSPSREFALLGRDLMDGLDMGMRSGAVGDRMPAPSSLAMPSAVGGGGSRPIEVSIPLTINLTTTDGRAADELGERLTSTLPGMLQAALQRAAIEAGV